MTQHHPEVAADAGVMRRVLAQRPELMLVSFRFETGAVGRPHAHPHVQATYVASGRFRFIVEGESRELGPGDALVVPSGAEHGCVCLEAGELVDGFAPRRDDFL